MANFLKRLWRGRRQPRAMDLPPKPTATPELLAALGKYVGMKIADPALSELKPEDWPKLRALETAWRRSGDEAFERMFESDLIGFVRIVGAANPRAMREALEDEIAESGMTKDEFLATCMKAARKRMH